MNNDDLLHNWQENPLVKRAHEDDRAVYEIKPNDELETVRRIFYAQLKDAIRPLVDLKHRGDPKPLEQFCIEHGFKMLPSSLFHFRTEVFGRNLNVFSTIYPDKGSVSDG
jgi:hypothetical protein